MRRPLTLETMAAPRLTVEQRVKLLELLAAGYSEPAIAALFELYGWKPPTAPLLHYYRRRHRERIRRVADEREVRAITSGLALRAERVAKLCEHADELEAIMWVPDPLTGRYHNAQAWRETLRDIAHEMGDRARNLDYVAERVTTEILDRIRPQVSPSAYRELVNALHEARASYSLLN